MQNYADAQILLYPASAIPNRLANGFIVADQLADFSGAGWADALGITPESFAQGFQQNNPTISIPWAQNPRNVGLKNVHFARFHPDGTMQLGASTPLDGREGKGDDLAGFFVMPRSVALDCRINNQGGEGQKTAINWDGELGTWQPLPPLSPDAGSAIYTTGGEDKHQARTRGAIPANRGFQVTLDFLLKGRSGTHPTVRFRWGDEWALSFRHDLHPVVERALKTDLGGAQIELKWSAVKTLSSAPKTDMRGHSVKVTVFRLAGRMCIFIDGRGFWLLDTGFDAFDNPGGVPVPQPDGTTPQPKPKKPKASEINWREAPLGIEAFNARVSAALSVIKWSNKDGSMIAGEVTRSVTRNSPLDAGQSAQGTCSGWKRNGTQAIVVATIGGGSVDYTLKMAGNPDGDGIESPFITKIGVRYAPAWTNENPTPLDVRGACLSLSWSEGMPPRTDGASCALSLSRHALKLLDPNWDDYAQMWNPIEIRVRRAGNVYKTVFKGYIFKPDMNSDDAQSRTLTILGKGEMIRAQKMGEVHNCIVDHRFPPLDLIFAEKLASSVGGYGADGRPSNGALYIADCVQETARIGLGDAVADNMNGNGDARRFLLPSHPPLFSPGNDLAGWAEFDVLTGKGPVVSEGGWMLPAPFGDALFDWWSSFAKRDYCVFYFRQLPDSDGEPILVYGRLPQILGADFTRTHVVRDVKVNGNWERLLHSANVERRPERDANRILVVGDEAPGLKGLLPSLRMAEAQLPPDDPRHARNSWERTYWLREPSALLGAEAIASGIAGQLAYVDLKWPTLNFEGDERISVGDLLAPVFSGPLADTELGISGQKYRIEALTHNIVFSNDSGTYRTTATPRPLSATERAALSN